MSDEFKKWLSRELEEIKRDKFRIIALVIFVIVAVVFWLADYMSRGEELALNEPTISAPPATKDLPVKNLPAVQSVDGVTIVLGADAKPLLIADPFAGAEKPKPVTKTVAPPPILLQPPPEIPKPQKSIVLTGTAISGENKTAMFLRGKETIFLTVGDEIDGRKISDITSDFVQFADGSILTIKN